MTRPPRIVSLVPAATEIVSALGRSDQLVGASEECLTPPSVDVPRLTRTRGSTRADSNSIDGEVRRLLAAGEPLFDVDESRLAKLKPDVLLVQRQCSVCAVDADRATDLIARLEWVDRCTVVALAGETIDGVLEDVRCVGEAIGAAPEAVALVAELRRRLARRSGAGPAAISYDARPRVACIEWYDPLMLAGAWTPELIHAAGGRCELTTAGRHAVTIGWEDLRSWNPELIVLCPCGFDVERARKESDRLTGLPGWQTLDAVRPGAVYLLDGTRALTTPGPGLIDAAELMAAWLAGDETPHESGESIEWGRL